jgi:hypothetical protein
MEKTVFIFSGQVEAPRCQARSKRTGKQCGQASARNNTVCKWHGGKSTGPKTLEGRKRCAAAKTIHGTDTRELRIKYRLKVKELNALYDLLPWYAKGRL